MGTGGIEHLQRTQLNLFFRATCSLILWQHCQLCLGYPFLSEGAFIGQVYMQVKRYIDVCCNSSVVGFSSDDMLRISGLYSAAEQNWSNSVKHILMDRNGDEDSTNTSSLKEQIAAYLNFFSSVVELARSRWTEFNLNLMITGFGILVISLVLQLLAVFHGNKSYAVGSWLSTGAAFTLFIVTIRACSFLSNSYI